MATAVEEGEASGPRTLSLMMQREYPLVLRKAATSRGSPFLESPGVKNLKTTWRVHRLGSSTVWEADCAFLEATVGQFLEWETSTGRLSADEGNHNPFAEYDRSTHWVYADYKHVKELAEDWGKALEHIVDWSAFGCNKTAADSTIWLGTEGSHTPLHYDTYGVNLVAQLHGKKKWLLYSPDETVRLSPTRVPYEESSVFSRVDARGPDLARFPRFADAHPMEVTLDPGDVLFVPNHWWHFVEAVETSLSVNVWLEAPGDAEDRCSESVARVLMTSLADGLDTEIGPDWLNPTEKAVWPLAETLAIAQLAFRGLHADPERDREANGDDGGPRATVDGGFSVRAMVDAMTAPDVLQLIVERISQRRQG
eukprot:g8706.t1